MAKQSIAASMARITQRQADTPAPTVAPSSASSVTPAPPRPSTARHDEKFTMRIDGTLLQKVKTAAVMQRLQYRDAIETALRAYVEDYEQKHGEIVLPQLADDDK